MTSSDNVLLVSALPQHSLTPGRVDKVEFRLLMELTSINSARMVNALEAFLVMGHPRDEVCRCYKVNAGYFSQRLKVVNRVSQIVGALLPYYAGPRIGDDEE